MWLEAVYKPIRYQWPGGEIRLIPGVPAELPDDRARRLLEKADGDVRVVNAPLPIEDIQPGDMVAWLSPLLPEQQGEVLAVHPDETFLAFHPLTEILCKLPLAWVTRIVMPAERQEGERAR